MSNFHPALLALPILFAWADRFIGGGFGWEKWGRDNGGPLRGGPAPYAMLALFPACWFIGGAPLLCAAISWMAYRRAFGWSLGGSSAMTPVSGKDHVVAFVRHGFVAIFMALFWVVGEANGWGEYGSRAFVAGGLVFAAVATLLASLYARQKITDLAHEAVRGAVFGYALAIAAAC